VVFWGEILKVGTVTDKTYSSLGIIREVLTDAQQWYFKEELFVFTPCVQPVTKRQNVKQEDLEKLWLISLEKNKTEWRALGNTVTNFMFSQNVVRFLTCWVTISFSKRILLQGVICGYSYVPSSIDTWVTAQKDIRGVQAVEMKFICRPKVKVYTKLDIILNEMSERLQISPNRIKYRI
jgi:hypothetical protein